TRSVNINRIRARDAVAEMVHERGWARDRGSVVRFGRMTRALSILLTIAPVAFGQSAGMKAIDGAAQALGGKEKLLAIKTLTMEGSGVAPNIGQNPFPEGPLPTWW